MKIINHVEIKDGHAVIRGHGHLKAKMVARKYVWENVPVDEIMVHYELTAAEVHSAIAYYYDHQEELDAEYAQTVEAFRDEAITLDKLKAKIAARNAGSDV
ncbi:MAG: hypothetical protein RLP44_24960 [Aggregatilineales bacterium]